MGRNYPPEGLGYRTRVILAEPARHIGGVPDLHLPTLKFLEIERAVVTVTTVAHIVAVASGCFVDTTAVFGRIIVAVARFSVFGRVVAVFTRLAIAILKSELGGGCEVERSAMESRCTFGEMLWEWVARGISNDDVTVPGAVILVGFLAGEVLQKLLHPLDSRANGCQEGLGRLGTLTDSRRPTLGSVGSAEARCLSCTVVRGS